MNKSRLGSGVWRLGPRVRVDGRSVLLREAVVRDLRDGGTLVGARFMDRLAGRNRPKRCQLLTGEHAGETRMRGDYEVLEFCEPGQAPGLLAMVWADE